jgi:2-polyprenyl-3-methyl-5-hydroxy-6-metoxy-1,4-benzoquinol methylase
VSTFNQAQYDDLSVKAEDAYAQAKYDILLDYLGGGKGLRVFNAGCGSGELSLRLAACGNHVVGIDPEPAYIDLALRNAVAEGTRGRSFEVCSIEGYDGPGDFDCVIATDVLEHIADDRAAFAKLVDLVKPGGLVLITVPAGPWLFGYHDEQLGHFRRYSRAMLHRLVADACIVDEIRYFACSLIPVCYLFSKVLRRPYPVAESGDARKRPLVARALRGLLQLERRLPLPLGTSVIFKGTRKARRHWSAHLGCAPPTRAVA